MTIIFAFYVYISNPRFPGRHDLLTHHPEFRLSRDAIFAKVDCTNVKWRFLVKIDSLASVAYFSDDMVRLFRLRPSYDTLKRHGTFRRGATAFRMDDLYEAFIEPTLEAFERLHLKLAVYGICCDNPYNQGPQKNRAKAASKSKDGNLLSPITESPDLFDWPMVFEGSLGDETGGLPATFAPYPQSATFTDEGMQYVCFDTDTIRTEPVNMQRLMLTRSLRVPLYEYFLDKMRQDRRLRTARVLFSFDKRGPYAIASGKVKQKPELVSSIAEADLDVVEKALKFDHPVLASGDRDVEIIALINAHRFEGTLHVVHSPVECIDAKSMARSLESAGSSPEAFGIAVMLCGTDYCNRSRPEDGPFPRVSEENIVESVHCMIHVAKVPILKSFRHFMKLVVHAHTMSGTRSYPSETACRNGFTNARMNFEYWASLHNRYSLSPTASFILTGKR